MSRGRVAKVLADRREGQAAHRFPDHVIVEEPLEVRIDDVAVGTTMRTPGHDFELAVGFCVAEGLLAGTRVTQVRYCGTASALESEFNVVSVETARRQPIEVAPRLTTATSACGLCGSQTLAALTDRLVALEPPPSLDATLAAGVAGRVRERQPLFDATGSVHAAAAFDLATGDISVVREDVGRHNAVDKVVGRLTLDGALPLHGMGLFVSGRAGFEMAQKAWAAGFRWLLAVGGPSSLAVATARRANLGLAAFVRGPTFTVYSPDDGALS